MASRTSTFDELISDTLAKVNVVRDMFGYQPLNELPDARPGDTKDCLFYRALKDVGCQAVGGNSLTFSSERQAQAVADVWGVTAAGKSVTAPRDINRTITAFDRGDVPHYNI